MKTFLPDHSPLRAILPLCLALLLMAAAGSPASQIFRYREQTGDDSFTFSWQADREQNSGTVTVTVTQKQGEEMFSSGNTPEGKTLSWRYVKQPDTDVRAERIGDRIHFSGRFGGTLIDRYEDIDPRPWYQPLSFSLQRMIARDQQEARFWTIRPDTLEVLAMRARKKAGEQVAFDNGTVQAADKVVIHPDGLLSALWQAEYWFRHGDNVFVQYRGTHGLPGTAETRVCLISP